MSDPFVDPLQFLTECHGRIRLRLEMFREEAAALRGTTPRQRHSLEAAILFFRTSGAAHTVDEEESLFPRIYRALESLGRTDELEELRSREGEHRVHEEVHERLEAALRRLDPTLGEGDGLPDPDAPLLASGSSEALAVAQALEELVELYEAHIPLEDSELFPLARQILSPAEIEAIALEMRRRHSLGRKLL